MAKKVLMTKKDDGKKKPIALKEVRVTATRIVKPQPKPQSSRQDSIAGGYGGKFKNYAVKDVKNMVKTNNMKSIDTTSTRNMANSMYGKPTGFIDNNMKIAKDKRK